MIANVIPFKVTALAAAVSLAVGGVAGWKLHDALVHQPHLAADQKAARKSIEAARASEAKAVAIAVAARDAGDTRQAEIRTVTQTIVKEVPRYVSATVQCPAPSPAGGGAVEQAPRVALADVSVGFGVLHDAAARGHPPLPPAAGVDLDAPGGAGMPAVAGVVVRNYGRCLGWREEAVTWRGWYRAQAEAWPVK